MTLIVAASNMTGAVMVGDRRLSRAGVPVAREVTKIGCVMCNDARLLVGFSGLGELRGPASMHQWLPEAIGQAVRTTSLIETILPEIATKLAAAYSTQPQRFRSVPLTVLCCGYQYRGIGETVESRGYARRLSGPDASGRFAIVDELATSVPGSGYYTAIGQVQALKAANMSGLAELLLQGKPWRAQAAKTVDILTRARISVEGVVGSDFSILYLPRDLAQPVQADYYNSVVTSTRFYGFFVDPTITMTDWSADVRSSRAGPTKHLTAPKVGGNSPCPCGSGVKYKHCHGRRK